MLNDGSRSGYQVDDRRDRPRPSSTTTCTACSPHPDQCYAERPGNYALVRAHGEAGWAARLIPLTVDGLIYASSVVLLDTARRKVSVPALARWLLGLGIAATLAANVAHGPGHGLIGAAIAAWPAVALVGSYELLMMIIRDAQLPADRESKIDVPRGDPLHEQAALMFADELGAARVPSVRARLHVGQPRAQRIPGISPQSTARDHIDRSSGPW